MRSQVVVSLAVTLGGFCCLSFDGGGVFCFVVLLLFLFCFRGGGRAGGEGVVRVPLIVFCQLMSVRTYAC